MLDENKKHELENLLYNYKYLDTIAQNLKSQISGLYETESGVVLETPYTVEHKKLEDKLETIRNARSKALEMIVKESTFNSYDIAKSYAKEIGEGVSVYTKNVKGLIYLCVGKESYKNASLISKNENVIDVGLKISKDNKRSLYISNKIVDGRKISVKNFLPEKYKDVLKNRSIPDI